MKNIFRIFMIWIFVTIFLCLTVSAADDAYSFGVLRYVEKSGNSYTANIYIDGKNQNFVLNSSSAIETDTMVFTAEELYDFYKISTDTDGNPAYSYLLICGTEKKSGGYTLHANKNPDRVAYKIVPAGTTISYNYITGLCRIGDMSKVVIDSNSVMYYEYDAVSSSGGATKRIGQYGIKDLPVKKSFTVKTSSDTYLYYDNDIRVYRVLATIVANPISGAAVPSDAVVSGGTDVPSYGENGANIIYAYKSGSQKASSGIIYNYNYFMNMTTVVNKSGAFDKRREYHETLNKGTEGGYFYGKNDDTLTYDKITRSVLDTLDTMKLGETVEILKSGSNTYLVMNTESGELLVKLTSNTIIWGLSQKGSIQTYKKLTDAQLETMIALVDSCNLQKGTSVKINALVIYKDNEQSEAINLVVEIFEKDSSGYATSVNDTVFRNLGVAPDVTPTDTIFVSCDKNEYYDTDSVKAKWNSVTNATGYILTVTDISGATVYTKQLSGKNSTEHSFSLNAGTYCVKVQAVGASGISSNSFELNVKRKYFTVSYNLNGGSGEIAPGTKTAGKTVTLTTARPVREGYAFLGWSLTPTSYLASYSGGESLSDDKDITLFAVWQKYPEFAGVSLILDSKLGIRVYLDIDGEIDKYSAYIYSVEKEGGWTSSYGNSYLEFDSEKNLYYSEHTVYSADAHDWTVTCTLNFYDYSSLLGTYSLTGLIAEYKELAESDSEYARVLDLVNALEIYIEQSDAFFDNGKAPAFKVEMDDVALPVKTGSATAISHVSTSLRVFETIDIRHYFVLDNNKSHTYKCSDANVRVNNLGQGVVAVDILDITPDKLDKVYTLTVDGTLSISYSVLNYVKAMENDTRVGSFVNALYNYWYYAKEYVNK